MKTRSDNIRDQISAGIMQHSSVVGRAFAQVEFAEALTEFHPAKAAAWRRLTDRATKTLTKALGDASDVAQAAADAERILAPIAATAKSYTIHCVGHGHIDMNWKWDWSETVALTNDTFTTVLRLMDEFPEFKYSQSMCSTYEIAERYNPRLWKGIKRRVKDGRWEVTATHWVEGDKNMAAAETLCRSVLYARRYVQKSFGLSPEDVAIDWEPDTFGHSAAVPTYLNHAGIKYYYCCHTGSMHPDCPHVFWWKGPDGARVLTYGERRGYVRYANPDAAFDMLTDIRGTGLKDYLFVFGVGDHGGGPTRGQIMAIAEMNSWPVFPTLRYAIAQDYFTALEKSAKGLPTIDMELNFSSTGCYTSNSLTKRGNRRCESQLVDAEAAALIAGRLAGEPHNADRLREAWQTVAFHHFHDILPGCNVQLSHNYVNARHQDVQADTAMIETNALRHLASKIDTSDPIDRGEQIPDLLRRDGMGMGVGHESGAGAISQADQSDGSWPRKVLLFNPTVQRRAGIGSATVWEHDRYCVSRLAAKWGITDATPGVDSLEYCVRTPGGKTLPAQLIETHPAWHCRYARVVFPIEPLEGLGYGIYTIVPEPHEARIPRPVSVRCLAYGSASTSDTDGGFLIENGKTRVLIGGLTGAIRSLQTDGLELVPKDGRFAEIEYGIESPSGEWGAWVNTGVRDVTPPTIKNIAIGAGGPYIGNVRVEWTVADSSFTTVYELRHDDPAIYVCISGFWAERGTQQTGVPALRLAMPVNLSKTRPRYEIPFGSVVRPYSKGDDVPALRWASVDGTQQRRRGGVLLINDGKHGHSFADDTLRLSLIRSSYSPDPAPEIGEHEIHLAIHPYTNRLSPAEATRLAAAFNQPLRVVSTDVHKGSLPTRLDGISVSPANVVVSAVKRAEEGDGILVRLVEMEGRRTTARIKLAKQVFGAVKNARTVDLMERPAKGSAVKREANTLSVTVPANGLSSVLIGT